MNRLAKLLCAAVAASALLLTLGWVASSPPPARAAITGILNGQFGMDQAFAVLRTPAYPACVDDTSYSPWTVTLFATLAGSMPYSEATGAPVNLGPDHLRIVASGNVASPWGIARFTPGGAEVRYDGAAWVTEPGGGWTTETPFTDEGQLYGLGDEGFMHDSSARNFGTFFSNIGVLVPNQAVSYTPRAEFNVCPASRAIADVATVGGYPVPSAPVYRNELASLTPTAGSLSPAFSPTTPAYTLTVPAGSTSVEFDAIPADSDAEVDLTAGGTTTTLSGPSTGAIPLGSGTTTVALTIRPTAGTALTYTIDIVRASGGGGGGAGIGGAADDTLADTGNEAVPFGVIAVIGMLGGFLLLSHRARRRRTLTPARHLR